MQIANRGFNIIRKYPQKEHIADEVHPAAVQEYTGEQGIQICSAGSLYGNSTILVDKGLHLSLRQRELKQEYNDVQGNEAIAENGKITSSNLIIANGKRKNHEPCV